MVWNEIRIYLPSGWYEVPGESPRLFRSGAREKAGRLWLSLYPPLDRPGDSDEQISQRLLQTIERVQRDMGIGPPLDTASGPCEYGLSFGAVFKSERYGLSQHWLLSQRERPVIAAAYVMGHIDTVQAEIEDLADIVASLNLIEVDPPSWAQ